MAIINNREIDNYVNQQSPEGILNYLFTNAVYINLPFMLTQNKVLPLTIGEGILFDSENEDLLTKLNIWSEQVRFYEKVRSIVIQMSLVGKSIAFLERKNKSIEFPNGLLMFKVSNLPLMSGVAKIDDIDQIAVIYTNTGKSDSPTLQKITFIPGKMLVENYSNPDRIRAQDLESEVLKELKPIGKTQIFPTNLQFMPFQEFPNRTCQNLIGGYNQTYLSAMPDWWLGRKLIFDVEDNLEKRRSERTKNQTRAFGQFDTEAIKNIFEGKADLQDFLGDMFFQANVSNYMTGQNSLAIIQGDPKLEVYHIDKEQTTKTFYETAGYNYFEKDGNYENETKSIMNYDLDLSTTKMKQIDIKSRLYRMLDIVVEDLGFKSFEKGKRIYSLEFISTGIVDDIRQLDVIDRRLANGTIDPIRAIRILDKVTKSQAEEYLKIIDKRQDEQIQKEQDRLNNEESIINGKGIDT